MRSWSLKPSSASASCGRSSFAGWLCFRRRGGAVLIGAAGAADVIRLQGFLTRNGYPHHLLDPAQDPEAKEVIARYADIAGGLPLVVCPDGSVLGNPSEAGALASDRPDGPVAIEFRL